MQIGPGYTQIATSVCMHVYVNSCKHVFIHICGCICGHVCKNACTRVHACAYVCVPTSNERILSDGRDGTRGFWRSLKFHQGVPDSRQKRARSQVDRNLCILARASLFVLVGVACAVSVS